MSDIFLSYASADENRAKALAHALQQKGWEVWWDRKIPPGRSFDEVIQEALDAAQCVIVLWSKISIGSDWVKEEATEGKRRDILVPCLIDEVNIPLGFSRIQAANLVDWQGESDHAGFESLCDTVATRIGDIATSMESENEPRELIPEVETKTHVGSDGSINDKPSTESELGEPSASPQRAEQTRPRFRKPMWAILLAVLLACVYLFGRNLLSPPPLPPSADAGPDRVVGRSTMVTLEASTQDVGRSEDIDYRWTQVAGPSVGTLTGSLPNFKTPDEITALAFELIVTSKGGQSEPDQVVFVVVDDPSSAFFVRADGNDEDAGTPANPLATLQTAINKAGDKGGGSVYVAGGKYAGSLSLVDGVSIYGGFDPNTWLRDSTRHITEIQGGETAVRGIRVRALSLDALTIRSVDASEPGGSSIALNLSASTGIVVNASRLIAGDGARGSDGQGARGGGKGLGGNTYKTGGRGANGGSGGNGVDGASGVAFGDLTAGQYNSGKNAGAQGADAEPGGGGGGGGGGGPSIGILEAASRVSISPGTTILLGKAGLGGKRSDGRGKAGANGIAVEHKVFSATQN